MKNDKEIVGTLQGFDDFVNMLLEDVTESEATPEGRRVTKLDQILLNGSNITMVILVLPNISFNFKKFKIFKVDYTFDMRHKRRIRQGFLFIIYFFSS